jgi:hypothetical protein
MEQEIMDILKPVMPFLVGLAVIQLGLMAAALIHIFKNKTYKTGSRALWVCVVILINMIGPVLYFVFGRGESEDEDFSEYS